ncbi:oxidoreductase [Atopobium fossor]|uniref:oxidoreductase n=1 Tax=Atopobium fossor TaxID=39487 RepID=UPI00040640FA|nr:methyltransferase domain-containing protein [Atopobium fossor]
MSSRDHYKNAGNPTGDAGRTLLDGMNSGTHERLAAWSLPLLKQTVEAAFSSKPLTSALDVGCGGGANLTRLMNLFEDAQVYGLDHSPISVETSKLTNTDAIAAGHCEITEGDVAALPYHSNSINLATAFETIYFWPDVQAGLCEIFRTLTPGGLLMVCNETDGRNFDQLRWQDLSQATDLLTIYSQQQLVEFFTTAGFMNVQVQRHPQEDWIVVFGQKPDINGTMNNNARLFSAGNIAGIAIKNKLFAPPMASRSATEEGLVSSKTLAYYDKITQSQELGMVIVEHHFVDPIGRADPHQLSAARDDTLEGLSKLAKTIHKHEAAAILQINHAGRVADCEGTPVGPTNHMVERCHKQPQALTSKDITKICNAFACAAKRAQKAGFDGVEIHAAHGYLLSQFISPLSNTRTDAYGGTIQNRGRFAVEVIRAVRTAVKDFPVFIRFGTYDGVPEGTTTADCAVLGRMFQDAGVDVIDISGGLYGYAFDDRKDLDTYFVQEAHAVQETTTIPIILAGGITKPEVAQALVAQDGFAMAGVARQLLRNPLWPTEAKVALTKKH